MPQLLDRIANRWRRLRFLLIDARQLATAEVRKGVTFHSPLKSLGKGALHIGEGTQIGFRLSPKLGDGHVLLQPRNVNAQITIGRRCHLGNNVSIIAKQAVSLGDDCLIGELVSIFDSDFHEIDPAKRKTEGGITKSITIGNNVWIGSRALILKGAQIGDNAVVGAQSVVTQSIPANSVAAGNPARIIRRLD